MRAGEARDKAARQTLRDLSMNRADKYSSETLIASSPPRSRRCARIRSISSGSSMLAITSSRPPQRANGSISIPNTPLVERFERWVRGRLDRGFSLDEAARALATSKRTLARRLKDTLGKTPLSYFQDRAATARARCAGTAREWMIRRVAGVTGASAITRG
jgi:AraC-like DNA-binding protein